MTNKKPFIVSNFESNEAPKVEELAKTELAHVSGGRDASIQDCHTTTCTYGGGCSSDGTDDYHSIQ